MSLIKDQLQKAKIFLNDRRVAYGQTFSLESKSAIAVLEDLAKFCRAHENTFHADPRAHALTEGRREVWLRIQHHLKLNEEQLWKLYGGNKS